MIAERSFDERKLMGFLVEVDNAFTHPLSLSLYKQGITLKEYVHKLANKGTIAYEEDTIGTIKGIVVGYTDNLPEDRCSYITQVVTNTMFRGQGVCSRLLKEYIEFCQYKNISYIWLTTNVTNIHAQKMYEKNGFVRQPTEKKDQIKYVYFIEHM